MKKLTVEQEEQLELQKSELIKENEKSVLFDLGKIQKEAIETKQLLEKLQVGNTQIKNFVRNQFQLDYKRVKLFLGDNADAVVVREAEETEPRGFYQYTIGVNDNKKISVTYTFSKDDYKDYGQAQNVDGIDHEVFKFYEIEIWAEKWESEFHSSFEAMFNDGDVVEMFEQAVLDYLVYGSKKKTT